MLVLRARQIEKSFGDRLVLQGCSLDVHHRDRVGLVGVNGSGKSTLVGLLAGFDAPDHGEVMGAERCVLLRQEPELPFDTVGEAAEDALRWHRELLFRYQSALEEGRLGDASTLQARLDTVGWSRAHEVDAMLDRLGAPPRSARIQELSGGERRRLALARALLTRPEVLLLDEPTNHLDADTIEWLQAWLLGYDGALVLITHDRYLLEAVADRIVEIEQGRTVSYEGSYADYLLERAERLASLSRAEARRVSLLRSEAAWAARSPAARSTKQKARLERLEKLKVAHDLPEDRAFDLELSTGIKTGRSVLELHDLRKAYGDRVLFRSLSLNLIAGERVGVVGPNGAGKSTLLRLIAGVEEPDGGEVLKAPRFKVAVLDQHRSGLSDGDTVFEAVGQGNDHVVVAGRPIHVAGFLRRMLFPREMLQQRVETLSGGERARLLLSRLLLQGCNLLLLDEPTNDLDLQTLGVLEEALLQFDGAAVIVTHDRAFLDRVCTRILSLHGDGSTGIYADRTQAIRARQAREAARRDTLEPAEASGPAPPPKPAATKRLSFKERQELADLPGQIEALEAEQAQIESRLADPATYREAADDVGPLDERLRTLPALLEAAYERWAALSEREP
ncbi:MAG: ABC transporter ATP-binding protein [Deltaproteobacteria bacterium]|nr:MAG: ABC transporter ATP-binding protein [Deltaproteobacteria bacterium]